MVFATPLVRWDFSPFYRYDDHLELYDALNRFEFEIPPESWLIPLITDSRSASDVNAFSILRFSCFGAFIRRHLRTRPNVIAKWRSLQQPALYSLCGCCCCRRPTHGEYSVSSAARRHSGTDRWSEVKIWIDQYLEIIYFWILSALRFYNSLLCYFIKFSWSY